MKRDEVRRLFMQHYGRMLRVARTLLADGQECEDVVCDVFEALLSGQTVLLPDTEESYLMASVRNRCLKRLRHEAIARSLAPLPASPEGEESERLTDIMEYVEGRLAGREQRIFRMRFCEGLPYEEIAAREGISRVAVWKNLSRIITLIKRQFNPRSL